MNKMHGTLKDYKSFGYLFSAIFTLLLGTGLPIYKHHPIRKELILLGLIIFFVTLTKPLLLKYPYRAWMKLSEVLGFISSRIILSALFALLITPYGIFYRLFSKKEVHAENTYRIKSKVRQPESMERIF